MQRIATVGIGTVLCLILMPRVAAPQAASAASITGAVKDTSGAVLPGVMVEASSPVLIEKVRTYCHRRAGAVSNHSVAARHLHRHLHPARLRRAKA